MRILMISTTFPYPPTLGGTEVRTYNLLCYLKQHGHEIDLVTQLEGLSTILTASPEQPLTSPSDIPDQVMADIVALRQVADTVAVFPLPPSPPDRPGLRGKIDKGLRFLQSIFSNIPP
ncbi:MAG: hypothetical protein ACO3NK_11425, partial [Prochlorotrichaceae cyanobacterium]